MIVVYFNPTEKFASPHIDKSDDVVSQTSERVAVVVPTYQPDNTTYQLVKNLVDWYPNYSIVVVDDSSPETEKNEDTLSMIKKIASIEGNLVYLRTPQNALKAGALNYGISYLLHLTKSYDYVFTLDDDVKIEKETLGNMTETMERNTSIGATCSLSLVSNKNKNILTRLQSLEYHSFNVTKIADNTFLKGPLVMQGMLTLFRMKALAEVFGYTESHLIEDYDITVKLKNKGWLVAIDKNARAWTNVPETLIQLWKQRIRWTYGGLRVVSEGWRNIIPIFQDVVGHIMFLSLFILVIASFVVGKQTTGNTSLVALLSFVALLNFLYGTVFGLIILRDYKERDWLDWAIKLTMIPEFIYSNIMTIILIGSYIYHVYNTSFGWLARQIKIISYPYRAGLWVFSKFGYSMIWGTKKS